MDNTDTDVEFSVKASEAVSLASLSISDTSRNTIVDVRGDLVLETEEHGDRGRTTRTFLVCSRALARSSPVFTRMLYGSLAEAKIHHQSLDQWAITLEHDADALELFCWISHHATDNIPRTLSLEQLVKLSLLTHYYDATAILAPWIDMWLTSIPEPEADDESQSFQVLWTCYELGQRNTFASTTRRILYNCAQSTDRGHLQETLDGHLSDLISHVDAIRFKTIDSMLRLIRDLTDILFVVDERPRWCRHTSYMGPHRCESMILGSMVFCLTRAQLWPIPKAEEVCQTHSVMSLYRQLTDIVIHDIGQPVKKGEDHAECNPRSFILERLQRILAEMDEPQLQEHRTYVENQHRKLAGNSRCSIATMPVIKDIIGPPPLFTI